VPQATARADSSIHGEKLSSRHLTNKFNAQVYGV
jgi:hypothetical protein